jgi:hypothetical protein
VGQSTTLVRAPLAVMIAVAVAVAGCSGSSDPQDPCAIAPVTAGGSAEVGRGDPFVSVADGEDFELELGVQGLWMFVLSARVRDVDVGDGNLGRIDVVAYDQTDAVVSLDVGCRARDWVSTGDGGWELASVYQLALYPGLETMLDGAMVRIELQVGDRDGTYAVDERTVVVRIPAAVTPR